MSGVCEGEGSCRGSLQSWQKQKSLQAVAITLYWDFILLHQEKKGHFLTIKRKVGQYEKLIKGIFSDFNNIIL